MARTGRRRTSRSSYRPVLTAAEEDLLDVLFRHQIWTVRGAMMLIANTVNKGGFGEKPVETAKEIALFAHGIEW